MRQYFLIPGVQYGEESDVRSEQAGIGRDGEQGLGNGSEQDAVNNTRILERQRRQFLWQREDHMTVRHWQKFSRPCSQPLVTSCGLALGTVSISA